MTDWVLSVERAYVAAATGGAIPAPPSTNIIGVPAERRARAIAAAGAIASRFLAVGTPRSLGLIIDSFDDVDAAALSVLAHRTWFSPPDVRCAAVTSGADALASATGGRVVPLAEALACDIVNHHARHPRLAASQLRRGTHVNVSHTADLDPDLLSIATIVRESDLPSLAAGLIDGRQLDEITFCLLDGAPLAAGL